MMTKPFSFQYYQAAVQAGKTIREMAVERGGIKEIYVYVVLCRYHLVSAYREQHQGEKIPLSVPEETRNRYERWINKKKTIGDIARETGETKTAVLETITRAHLLRLYHANYPVEHKSNQEYRTYEGLEALAERGLPLSGIGEHFGVSRERARQMINKKELYEQWRVARRERQGEKQKLRQERQALVGCLYQSVIHRAENDSAMEKALACYFSLAHAESKDLLRYYNLFRAYCRAKETGKKLSLDQLAEKSGLSVMDIGRKLRAVGEEPMHGKKDRHVLTSDKKRVVRKAIQYDTLLSYVDMEQIAGINEGVIRHAAQRHGIKKEKGATNRIYGNNFNEKSVITYARALDLYEALDAGLTREEAMEYAGIATQKGYDRTLEKRADVEAEVSRFKRAVGI